jgi:[protein-PII] uridylyltransferase
MTDLYQSNRTQAEKYFRQIQASLDLITQPEALPPFDENKPQAFYLDFKKKIAPWVEQETARQQKELERSDNSHLLLLKRTALVDAVMIASYRTALKLFNRNREVALKENDVPVVIVARGGYGREEMYFSSDVDIQMVLRSEASETEKEIGRRVIHYFEYLFVHQNIFPTSSSSGFSEIDAEDQALNEVLLPSFHSLLEHRFVAGNSAVYNEFKSSIKTASLIHKEEILKECFKHKTYFEIQNTVFQQEPNLKEELRRLYWATSLVRIRESFEQINQFELLSELHAKQKLSAPAFKNMQNALNFLSRMRMFLHCLQKGSQKDVMRFEVRDKMAESMGFKKKVNEFFQEYFFNAVLPMKRNCRNLFWETVTFATDDKVKKLSENFFLNSENQIIFAEGHEDFQWNSPIEIFHLFVLVARKNYFISYPVIRSIEANISRLTPIFQSGEEPGKAEEYFRSMMRSKYFAKALRYLHEFGLLESFFIPEFKNLAGLLQDIYVHMFPTDIHILAALDALNMIETDPEADPFLVQLYNSLKDKTTMKMAVLLHDIGKGIKSEGENEELVGAREVPRILSALGYEKNKRMISDIAFLVERHLMMYDLMLLDPDEDETFDMVWDLVHKDVERFKMLILLTYADRAGTKMKMSKSQIDQLKYFYQNTLHHKKQGDVSIPVKKEFFKMIRLPRDMQSQLQIYSEFRKSREQFAAEMFFKAEQLSELVVCCKDQPSLLYKIATVLAFNHLSIMEANIHTLEDNVFDVFKIGDIAGNPIEFSNFFYLQKQVNEDLRQIFVGGVPLSTLYKGRTLTTEIEMEKFKDIKLKVAIIGRAVKVETHDILGTIMMETKVFSDLNMEIQRAVLHSNYGTSSNVFYLRPEDVHQIIKQEAKFKKQLEKALTPLIRSEPVFPGHSAEVA